MLLLMLQKSRNNNLKIKFTKLIVSLRILMGFAKKFFTKYKQEFKNMFKVISKSKSEL